MVWDTAPAGLPWRPSRPATLGRGCGNLDPVLEGWAARAGVSGLLELRQIPAWPRRDLWPYR